MSPPGRPISYHYHQDPLHRHRFIDCYIIVLIVDIIISPERAPLTDQYLIIIIEILFIVIIIIILNISIITIKF